MGKITLNQGTMQYSKELHDDEYQLEKHFATKQAQLTRNIIHLAASQSNQFPLSAITEGGLLGSIKTEYIDENEFDYPVTDNINTIGNTIAKNQYAGDTTSQPGRGGSEFKMYLEEPLIPTYEYIVKGNIKVHCKDVVEDDGGIYEGTFTLTDATDPAKFVPLSAFEVGAKIAKVVSLNSLAGSRGNGSTFVTPYKRKNMLNFFRKTYKWEGEIPTKTVTFNYTKSGGDTKQLWMDYRKWQFLKEWAYEKEIGVWEGEYNKTEDGRILLKDKRSGNPVPRGSGLWEQIPNWDSYSVLTANKIKTVMREVFRVNGDTAAKDIKVFGGTIAAENFDNAMKLMLGENRFQGIGDKFVTGSDGGLQFGGYFNKYKSIDGNSFTFVKSRMFDDGPRAIVAEPYKGYSTESGKMVFIDDSNYDGEANLRMIIKKGLENLIQKVAGVGTQEGGSQPEFVSSDFHGSSHEYMTERNIQIMRNTNCFVLDMKLS